MKRIYKWCLPLAVAVVMAGCVSQQPKASKDFLSVDFKKGETLKYELTSSRKVELIWPPMEKGADAGKERREESVEEMKLVMSYEAVEVPQFGPAVIKAKCESVEVKRRKGDGAAVSQKDAMQNLLDKSFQMTVNASGKIEDTSQLEKLIEELGEKAFSQAGNAGQVKDPDMIWDFITLQWCMWDSISSLPKASEGVKAGAKWQSQLPITGPMVMRKARDVNYTLGEIQETPQGRMAVIKSVFTPAESAPASWPKPYTGSFQMKGTFGFLSGYKVLSLEGAGEESFNMDAGRIERYQHHYAVTMEASMPISLGVNPTVTIDQNFSMTRLP